MYINNIWNLAAHINRANAVLTPYTPDDTRPRQLKVTFCL